MSSRQATPVPVPAQPPTTARSPRPRRPNTAGLVSVEFVLLAVALLAGIYLALFAGRVAHARDAVQDIVAEAARVASTARNPSDAEVQMQNFLRHIKQPLTEAGVELNEPGASNADPADSSQPAPPTNCELSLISQDADSFMNGAVIQVRASCDVALSDLAFIAVPGSLQIEAEASEIIDVYRSGVS